MLLHEYHCPRCSAKFEMLRPVSRRDEEATCPQGHGGAQRALSVFAVSRTSAAVECGPGACVCAAEAGDPGGCFGGACDLHL